MHVVWCRFDSSAVPSGSEPLHRSYEASRLWLVPKVCSGFRHAEVMCDSSLVHLVNNDIIHNEVSVIENKSPYKRQKDNLCKRVGPKCVPVLIIKQCLPQLE